ncbi:MAG: molybdate ABC transporter substrate-binding protein [Desulfuromonadales bacterium]|nr:molybdate ABC transporter substrate-binding protein [Desulfuromonadales bacterium]
MQNLYLQKWHKLMPYLVFLCLLMISIAPSSNAAIQPVVVFAGSASQPPLEEAASVFEEETGIPIILHLGGSGSMLSQIQLTGQGDLYIPGSPDYMEKAKAFGLVESDATIITYLIPALIVAKGNPHHITGLHDLLKPGLRIGLADPEGVCVGLYAVEILEANDLTDRVRPNLRGMVESCAKTAALIPLNLVDVVLGWREFTAWNPAAMEAVLLNPDELPRLAYIPSAVLKHAKNPQAAETFMAFLKSENGQAIFQKWGYLTDESAARKFAPQARIGGLYQLPGNW